MIGTESIGTNRYAPDAVSSINLYSTESAEGLTLGQLVLAICIRRGVLVEKSSIALMNNITSTNGLMSDMAYWGRKILQGEDWDNAKGFLTGKCGISEDALPSDISTYDNQMNAYLQLKAKMDTANTESQQDTIDLQSMVNWRDMAYSLASSIISSYSEASRTMANNF